MHYTRFLLLFLFVLGACAKSTDLSLEAVQIDGSTLEVCVDKPCPEISLNYLYPAGEDGGQSELAKALDQWMIDAMTIREHPGAEPAFVAEAAERFALDYQDDKLEFPDMNGVYEMVLAVSRSYEGQSLWCFKMEEYKYTGGAHGNGSTSYLFFDTQLNEALDFEQLIADRDGFSVLAEKYFRSQNGLSPNQPINATGYWFEDDRYAVAESIGFEDDKVIMVYNPYEIASYADGPIKVEIPLVETESFLNLPEQK